MLTYPKSTIDVCSAYANAFEFGHVTLLHEELYPSPFKLSPNSGKITSF